MPNPPKSTAELKKAGALRKGRHENRMETQVDSVKEIPKPPSHLSKRHAEVWINVCEELFEMGAIASIDVYLLEAFVVHWVLWKDATKMVEKGITIETKRGEVKNPAINVMNEAFKVFNQIADKFGMSTRARMGIKVVSNKKEKQASILDFIKGGSIKKAV